MDRYNGGIPIIFFARFSGSRETPILQELSTCYCKGDLSYTTLSRFLNFLRISIEGIFLALSLISNYIRRFALKYK